MLTIFDTGRDDIRRAIQAVTSQIPISRYFRRRFLEMQKAYCRAMEVATSSTSYFS